MLLQRSHNCHLCSLISLSVISLIKAIIYWYKIGYPEQLKAAQGQEEHKHHFLTLTL